MSLPKFKCAYLISKVRYCPAVSAQLQVIQTGVKLQCSVYQCCPTESSHMSWKIDEG
jgi:hypothetical protein